MPGLPDELRGNDGEGFRGEEELEVEPSGFDVFLRGFLTERARLEL